MSEHEQLLSSKGMRINQSKDKPAEEISKCWKEKQTKRSSAAEQN